MATRASFTKRSLILKANSTMVVATSVAAFVVVFGLVASKTLLSQAAYQNRVISGKKTALNQLKTDLNARDTLVSSYKDFVGTESNVLGGNPTGTGQKDGDNAKLILDALPSQYDFPALASTLEKMITSQNLQIVGITGTDQELTQQNAQPSATPAAIPMPFEVQVNGSYQSIQNLVGLFEHSIRPFQIQTVQYTGDESNMSASITGQTYYQPAKGLSITKRTVQ